MNQSLFVFPYNLEKMDSSIAFRSMRTVLIDFQVTLIYGPNSALSSSEALNITVHFKSILINLLNIKNF